MSEQHDRLVMEVQITTLKAAWAAERTAHEATRGLLEEWKAWNVAIGAERDELKFKVERATEALVKIDHLRSCEETDDGINDAYDILTGRM